MQQGRDSSKTRPSIYDVAQVAGVSHMTVSRVINDYPHIRDATRQRVLQAMIKLGYLPKQPSKALDAQETLRIGILVDGAEHYGPRSTLFEIERAAGEHGHTVIAFAVPGFRDGAVKQGLGELRDLDVDALCIVAPRFASLRAVSEESLWVPAVVVGDDDSQQSFTTIATDQHATTRLAADHLHSLGHRSILHVAGPLDWVDALARERSWRKAIDERDLTPHLVIGDWTSKFGFAVGAEHPIIDEVTAVFAANDQMALGLLHGMKSRGIRVPEDVSIVGCDDSPEARQFAPPLTSVNQNFDQLGLTVVRAISNFVEGSGRSDRVRVAPRLVIRQSVAPLH